MNLTKKSLLVLALLMGAGALTVGTITGAWLVNSDTHSVSIIEPLAVSWQENPIPSQACSELNIVDYETIPLDFLEIYPGDTVGACWLFENVAATGGPTIDVGMELLSSDETCFTVTSLAMNSGGSQLEPGQVLTIRAVLDALDCENETTDHTATHLAFRSIV